MKLHFPMEKITYRYTESIEFYSDLVETEQILTIHGISSFRVLYKSELKLYFIVIIYSYNLITKLNNLSIYCCSSELTFRVHI